MHPGSIARRATIAGLAASAVLAALAGPASAGTYTQYTCRLPNGDPAATDGWIAEEFPAQGFSFQNGCHAGGSFAAAMAAASYPNYFSQTRIRWKASPGTQLGGITLYRAARLAAQQEGGSTTTTIEAGDTVVGQHRHPSSATTVGSFDYWRSDENKVVLNTQPSFAANELSLMLGCRELSDAQCSTADVSSLRLYAGWITIFDDESPAATSIDGSMSTDGAKRGVLNLSFSVTDRGAGLHRVVLEVNGREHTVFTPDENDGRCKDAVPTNEAPYEFQHRVPCPLSLENVEVSLDTTELSEGEHTVRVLVLDASGNSTAILPTRTITVDNVEDPGSSPEDPGSTPEDPGDGSSPAPTEEPTSSPPPAPEASPPAPVAWPPAPQPAVRPTNGERGGAGVRIVAERSSYRLVRTRYGRRVKLTGRLVDPSGLPVANASVDVLTRTKTPQSNMRSAGTVRSKADGSFEYLLPAGPSRLVRFGYRAFVGDTAFSHTFDTDVRVRAKLSLRLSHKRLRNGKRVRYSGRLYGVGTKRKIVDIQARSGNRWVPVCSARTRTGGKYSCRYRFRRTFQSTRYRFRARVRAQSGLPYETSASASRWLRVVP